MRFLDPKNDYAFKRIFGSEESKDILMSFLNAILYQEREVIKDLTIINPHALGATFTLKDTYLDVKAKLDNNTTVLIEMQLLNKYAFEKRVVYNAAKIYANQLDSGERYLLLEPVIALTIADFILFQDSPKIINSFVFKEEKQNFIYNEEIKLFFVELPKFNKTLEELNTLSDKWLFFLRNASNLTEKPVSMETITVLNKALEISNLAGLSVEELEEIQKRQIWLTDQETTVRYARETGIQQGIDQGEKKLVNRLIRHRFADISPEIENKINQLAIDQLELLGEQLFDFSNENDLINWLDSHYQKSDF